VTVLAMAARIEREESMMNNTSITSVMEFRKARSLPLEELSHRGDEGHAGDFVAVPG
jgi:hypothetical protein